MFNYKSIEKNISDEIIIKKSRFITYLFPIENEEAFQERLSKIKKEHYKANHHCYAYILGQDALIQRMSDDGEPSGTAGLPMLEVLKHNELTFIGAITVRYFGGIKLGAGGLIRAYSSAVSEALQKAPLIQNVDQLIVDLEIDYAQVDPFNHYMQSSPLSLNLLDSQYAIKVTHKLSIYPEDSGTLQDTLNNLFNGQYKWEELGIEQINIPLNIN